MAIITRPLGDTDLQNAIITEETGLPQTVTGIPAGDTQIGRVEWSPTTMTILAPVVVPGDIDWATGLGGRASFQYQTVTLNGGTSTSLPIGPIALDVPTWGNANSVGSHKAIQDDATFDWTNWDSAVTVLTANSLTITAFVSPIWPQTTRWEPTPDEWRGVNDQMWTDMNGRTGSAAIPTVRIANEFINPSTATGYISGSWITAAEDDPVWTLAPELCFLYSAKGAYDYRPALKTFVADYFVGDISGSALGSGPVDVPADQDIANFHHQRFYIAKKLVQDARAAIESAGPGSIIEDARLDAWADQGHYEAHLGFSPEAMKWQMWELQALDVEVWMSEINVNVTEVGNLVGILSKSSEMYAYAAKYTVARLYHYLKYTPDASKRLWTWWTEFADGAEDRAMTLYRLGQRSELYEPIKDLLENLPTPEMKIASRTLFYASGRATLPVHLIGGDGVSLAKAAPDAVKTNINLGSSSLHPTNGFYMPMSSMKKSSGGVMTNFNEQDRTTFIGWQQQSGDAPNADWIVYRELDGANERLRIQYAANGDVNVYINGGAATKIGDGNGGSNFQVTFRYDGTEFEFAYARWENDVHYPAVSTVKVTATITDVTNFEFARPNAALSASRAAYHGMYDGDSGAAGGVDAAADTAELIALSPFQLDPIYTQAQISAFDPATENA